VTGTSVLGIIFKDGVMLAADTLGAYCSLCCYAATEPSNRFADMTVLRFDVCPPWVCSLRRIIWVHEAV